MRDDVTHFLSYAKVRLGGDLSFVFCLLIEVQERFRRVILDFSFKVPHWRLLTGVIIISSRETAHLSIGYHGAAKNVFRNGLRRFEESAHQSVEDFRRSL